MPAASPLIGSIDNGSGAPPPFPPAQAEDGRVEAAAVAIPGAVDIAVVGAGVIGLSIAWRLALRGLSVAVFERATAGAGASLAATGMLAAAAEHEPGCRDLLALALESQRQWPQFRAALETQSGRDIDFREGGTLVVALGRDEVERLRFRHDLHKRCGLPTRWLSGPEVRAMEPALRPSVAAGLYCADDHQVDPRLVMAALRAAYAAAGGRVFEHCAVTGVDLEGGRVTGLVTAKGTSKAVGLSDWRRLGEAAGRRRSCSLQARGPATSFRRASRRRCVRSRDRRLRFARRPIPERSLTSCGPSRSTWPPRATAG